MMYSLALPENFFSHTCVMAQALLFRDPSPLVERLGLEFFRSLPQGPGIYLMRGRDDALLYLGKAKNLRRRLGSYRVANPDRLPRRHLRLLREVEKIEVEECADESAALQQEARLLRALKPRYNRAGTWPGPTYYFCWHCAGQHLHLRVAAHPPEGWNALGPMGRMAYALQAALGRMLWLATDAQRDVAGMPAGWFRGALAHQPSLRLAVGDSAHEFVCMIDRMVAGEAASFQPWKEKWIGKKSLFEQNLVQTDLAFLQDILASMRRKKIPAARPFNLEKSLRD